MDRSYEQDAHDVALVQAGDSEAFTRLVEEYRPNLMKVARQYEESVPFEQARDMVLSAFGEWLMTCTATEAMYLRTEVPRVARRALNGDLHGGVHRRMLQRCQAALRDMEPRVGDVNEPAERLTLDEAARKHEVSRQTLLTFMGMHEPERHVPFEKAMGEWLDIDDEALFQTNDEQLDPRFDPEFSNEGFIVDLDVCESTPVSDASDSSPVNLAQVIERLTDNQREVAELLMNGMSQHEVARALNIGQNTVSSRVRGIRRSIERAGL